MKRTDQQNKALHVYCQLLADAFNDRGHDKVAVLTQKAIPVQWTPEAIKEELFKAIMRALYPDKVSTTELERSQVNKVYEALNQWTHEKFDIFLEFPSEV